MNETVGITNELFTAQPFGSGSDEFAVVIAGFKGRIEDFKGAAQGFERAGYDGVIYAYDDRVITEGQPELLPQLISALTADVNERAKGYKAIRYSGASMGTAIGVNLMKHPPEGLKVEPGLFVAAGASVGRIIFRHPLFHGVRKTFLSNGHTLENTEDAWAEIHRPPGQPFVLGLALFDYVIGYRKVKQYYEGWQRQGADIRIFTLKGLGHNGIIKWFNQSIPTLLDEAKELES